MSHAKIVGDDARHICSTDTNWDMFWIFDSKHYTKISVVSSPFTGSCLQGYNNLSLPKTWKAGDPIYHARLESTAIDEEA